MKISDMTFCADKPWKQSNTTIPYPICNYEKPWERKYADFRWNNSISYPLLMNSKPWR